MEKKKNVLNVIFILLIAVTFAVFAFLEVSVLGGSSDKEPLNDAVMIITAVLFTLVFISELELWHDVKYFALCTKKTKLKSTLNAICAILAVCFLFLGVSPFIGGMLIYMPWLNRDSAFVALTVLYSAIRAIYFVVFKIILSKKGVENE